MPNPILEQANNQRNVLTSNKMDQLRPQLRQIKQQMRQLQALQNPQMALNQMLMNNPQLQNVMSLIKQSGNSPQQVFLNMANQMGVDPNEVIKELQG